MIANLSDSKMSSRRAKTSGWAAFDQKQRQKDGFEARSSNESFPSLPSTMTSLQPAKPFSRNKHVKPFSSVIQPSLDFPIPLQDNMKNKPSEFRSSEGPQINEITMDDKYGLIFGQLQEEFGWADDTLIEDVMAAAGNDFDTASSFLKAMVSDQSSHEHKNIEVVNQGKCMHKKNDMAVKDVSEPNNLCSVMEPSVGNNNNNVMNECTLSAEKLFNDCKEINVMLAQLTSVPVEPEWEEDDVYLNCRKDAIKMMRAATRHSKAATNSFLRGDHISAQKFSLKAQEDWRAAQSLNAKAASEILRIRNESNGIWRLDLHGLHALEAVQAVKERLLMIETQMMSERSRPSQLPNNFRTKAESFHASYPDACNNLDKSDEQASHRLKPLWLEVITGIGNHSRGGAALPTAVRTFLADNGYRFDEARPGAIMVRPKFRPTGMT